MKEDKFFQFPLCTLAFSEGPEDRLEYIVSASIVRAGLAAWQNVIDEDETKDRLLSSMKLPPDFDKKRSDHWAILYGASISNVVLGGSINNTLVRHNALQAFTDSFTGRHGKDPACRVRADLVWGTKNGTGLSYRHFSLLVGLYSVIGDSERPVLVNRQMLRCRALGYKTPQIMRVELHNREDGAKLLTDPQIKYDLDKLQQWGWFSRVNPAAKSRRAYFSNRLSHEQLIEAVATREFHRVKVKALRTATANKVQSAVQDKLKELLSGHVLRGQKRRELPEACPNDGQTVSRP